MTALAFFIVMILAIVFLVVLYRPSTERSFLVEARTGAVTIVFDRGANAWSLPQTTVCVPVAALREDADDVCGVAFKPRGGEPKEELISWRAGAAITVTATPDGGVAVTVTHGMEPDYADGSQILVPADAWPLTGVLTFSGAAIVGADMKSNTRHYLYSGRWEAREANLATSFLRGEHTTEVLRNGALATGAVVSVLRGDDPAVVHGHIVPAENDTLLVTLLSEFDNTLLSVRHYGLDGPVLIAPDWVDVANESPLLLAVIALLALAGTIFSQIAAITKAPGVSDAQEKGSAYSESAPH